MAIEKVYCKKTKFASLKFAEEALTLIKEKSKREKIPIRAYLCHCGSYHLTSTDHYIEEVVYTLLEENLALKKSLKEKDRVWQKKLDLAAAENPLVIKLREKLLEKGKILGRYRKESKDLIHQLNTLKNKLGV